MATLEQSRLSPAAAESIVLTTNPGDAAVNPGTVEGIASEWQDGGTDASVYAWSEAHKLQPNMVDDVVNADKFDEVYPILIDLFTGADSAPSTSG